MSNNPDIYISDAEQREIAVAETAIDWINSLPKRISLLLIDGAITHGLDVTKSEATEAMGLIEEALGDLFFKDRCRLEKIAGYTPVTRGESFLDALNQSSKAAL